MRIRDLHELPKLRDGLSYLYLEHCIIDQKYKAVEAIDKEGRTMIPAANLAVLMLGPGTSITHEAVKTLTDNGCSLLWCGEEGVRLYAQGMAKRARAIACYGKQSWSANPVTRMEVVIRMYKFRFGEELEPDLTLEQIRGHEGVRVRKAYAEASRTYGVPWRGRNYDRRTGPPPTRSTGRFQQPTLASTASVMPPLCRPVTRQGWGSSTPASNSRSSTMSPTCTRPTSPCRWPSG